MAFFELLRAFSFWCHFAWSKNNLWLFVRALQRKRKNCRQNINLNCHYRKEAYCINLAGKLGSFAFFVMRLDLKNHVLVVSNLTFFSLLVYQPSSISDYHWGRYHHFLNTWQRVGWEEWKKCYSSPLLA